MHIPAVNTPEQEQDPEFRFTDIRSFEDACDKLNLDPSNLPNLAAIPRRYKKPIIAFYKLMVITAAINGAYKRDFSKRDHTFFPYYYYDSEGIEFEEINISSFTMESKISTYLAAASYSHAKYIAENFKDLYADFMLINRSINEEVKQTRFRTVFPRIKRKA
jgi:hypothetical protein